MARNINFFDGSQSGTVPTIGDLEASKLKQYANDAAYEASEGAAEEGDLYSNTTLNVIRYYNGTTWQTIQTAPVAAADVSYDNATSGLTATDAQAAIDEVEGRVDSNETNISNNSLDIVDLETLSGSAGATDHGTFTGTTIPDNSTTKASLQSLETEVESKVDTSLVGANNGVASLDGSGLVPTSQLPANLLSFEGSWDAATNTPTLTSGVGSEGDAWIVQNAGTFVEQPIDSSGNTTLLSSGNDSDDQRAQQFVASDSGDIDGVELKLNRAGTAGVPTGNFTIELQADSSDEPDGTALASVTVNVADLAADENDTYVKYTFSSAAAVTNTNKYWIVIIGGSHPGVQDNVAAQYDNGGTFTPLYKFSSNGGSTWGTGSIDLAFRVEIGAGGVGTTDLDGIDEWYTGDWAVFDGTVWTKVDNSDLVTSVAGKTGAVTLDADDIDDAATTNKFNQTHTGEVTGATALTVDSTAVSNKTLKASPAGTEEVLINDAGTLKKTTAQAIADLASGGTGNDIDIKILDNGDTPYTVLAADEFLACDTSIGVVQVNLPAVADDRVIRIQKTTDDTTGVAVQPNGADTVGGASNTTLHTVGETILLVGDATNGDWVILNRYTKTSPKTVTTIPIDSVNTNATKGTTTFDEYTWHRDGEFCIVKYRFKQTAIGTVGTGDYIAGLPFSADTTYYDLNTVAYATTTDYGSLGMVESGGRFSGTSGTDDVQAILYDADNFRIAFGRCDAAGLRAWSASGSNHAFNRAAINAHFWVRYKVDGWNK